jgi:cytoskeletal protein CcmA (bactofilin family)
MSESLAPARPTRPSAGRLRGRQGASRLANVGGKRFVWRRIGWLTVLGLLFVIASSAALAQSVLGGKFRTGDQIVVAQGETVEGDLYASARTVRIDGTVDGDLIAAGADVHVTGEVTGDLMVGSGSVDVSGRVGGDARLGAGRVTVAGSVGEDLLVGAGQITITPSGEVGEDFIFGTGRTTLDGSVAGDVLGSTGTYERRGTVGGMERVNIRDPEDEEEPTIADRLLGALQRFVSVLVVGALLLWLAPRLFGGSSDMGRRRPLASVGVGALTLVAFILLVVLIFIVLLLLGLLLGVLGLGSLLAVLVFGSLLLLIVLAFLITVTLGFVGPAIVGLAIGRLLLSDTSASRRWSGLALGVLVVVALSSIPVVGPWIGFLIALFGLGAVVLRVWPRRRPGPEFRPDRPDVAEPAS